MGLKPGSLSYTFIYSLFNLYSCPSAKADGNFTRINSNEAFLYKLFFLKKIYCRSLIPKEWLCHANGITIKAEIAYHKGHNSKIIKNPKSK